MGVINRGSIGVVKVVLLGVGWCVQLGVFAIWTCVWYVLYGYSTSPGFRLEIENYYKMTY